MHCIDDDTANPTEPRPNGRLGRLSLLFTLVAPATWLAACSSPMPPPVVPPPAAPRPWPNATPRPPAPGSSVRNWDEYRQRAAQRLVSANPDITYTGAVPEPLLAIPVLSVELNSDGSIAKIDVMRYPSQAKDTTQIAIDAVRRAAPFGYVGNLPKPWKYVETFLFDDNRRFKPVTLDR